LNEAPLVISDERHFIIHGFETANWDFQIADFGLRIADFGIQNLKFKIDKSPVGKDSLPSLLSPELKDRSKNVSCLPGPLRGQATFPDRDLGFWILDFGLRNVDCGFRISSNPNP